MGETASQGGRIKMEIDERGGIGGGVGGRMEVVRRETVGSCTNSSCVHGLAS